MFGIKTLKSSRVRLYRMDQWEKEELTRTAHNAAKTDPLYHRFRQKNEKMRNKRLGQRQTRSHRLRLYPMA